MIYPQAADVCGSLEIDSAIDTIRALSHDLAEAKREAQQGTLLPLPGESIESCALELGATAKTVGSSMAQLLTAANQGRCHGAVLGIRGHPNSYEIVSFIRFN